jgi:hypothetical protein
VRSETISFQPFKSQKAEPPSSLARIPSLRHSRCSQLDGRQTCCEFAAAARLTRFAPVGHVGGAAATRCPSFL